MQYHLFIILSIILSSCSDRVPAPIRYPDQERNNYSSARKNKIKVKDNISSKSHAHRDEYFMNQKTPNNIYQETHKKDNSGNDILGKVDSVKEGYKNSYKNNKDTEFVVDNKKSLEEKKLEQIGKYGLTSSETGELPVEGKIIARFGQEFNGTKQNGIIISAKSGSNIKAVDGGKVIFANYHKTFGNLIIIQKERSNIYFAYAHMQDIMLEKNALVQKGQMIGKVGSTGDAEEPELYFAVKNGNVNVDPIKFLNIKE